MAAGRGGEGERVTEGRGSGTDETGLLPWEGGRTRESGDRGINAGNGGQSGEIDGKRFPIKDERAKEEGKV